MEIYSNSNVGKKRLKNEDSFLCSKVNNFDILIVADGVGGTRRGEVASKMAVDDITKYLINELKNVNEFDKNYLEKIIFDAYNSVNNDILNLSDTEEFFNMATTAVLALIYDKKVLVANIGDSRCYIIGKAGYFKQITKDHTYVQQLVDDGIISKEEAFSHINKNVITRCLGSKMTSINVDFFEFELEYGDILLLCSDGLNTMLEDNFIEKIVRNNIDDTKIIVDNLIDYALDKGGFDNITLICAKVGD